MEALLVLACSFGSFWLGAVLAKKLRDRRKKKLFMKINGWAIARGEMINPWEKK